MHGTTTPTSALPLTFGYEPAASALPLTVGRLCRCFGGAGLFFAIALFQQDLSHADLRWRDFDQLVGFDVLERRLQRELTRQNRTSS